MQDKQSIKPTRLNLDASPKSLMENESYFLLNYDINNPNAVGKATPYGANYLACEIDLAAGENYANGNGYYSDLTDETYSWHYNSNGVHHIQRINSDGECEVVYHGDCLFLNAAPKHAIQQWRAILIKNDLCTKVPGGVLKQLIWVDGSDNPIGMLDVEASIATDSFTTPFFDICPDDCAAVRMCVPEPQKCLNGEFLPISAGDEGKANKLLDKGFKFIYRYIYYDRRASEWSDRSSLYYQDAKGCFDNAEGASRCLKFNLPIGNPLVEKIEFGFSEDGGLTWFLSDTIEKYKPYNDSTQYWYERQLSEDITDTFDEEECTFEYIFCNGKQRNPIDPLEISRVINPVPREVQGIIPIKNSVGFYNYKKGSCPIDKLEVDKFTIDINCEDVIKACDNDFVKVTVRALIYNEFFDRDGFIYRMGGGEGLPDDPTDVAWFGTVSNTPAAPPAALSHGYNQYFAEKVRNFIPYIEGTNYQGEMEQWRSTAHMGSVSKVGVLSGMDNDDVIVNRITDMNNGIFYYQEYIFNVPKGTKGFIRLGSHLETNALSGNQNKSTQVIGILDDLSAYSGNSYLNGFNDRIREIYFDTCSGEDLVLPQAFVVGDFYAVGGLFGGKVSSAYSGYITDKNNQPVEFAMIYRGGTYETTTDHNGFYSFYKYDGTDDSVTYDLHVEQSCSGGFTTIASFDAQSAEKAMGYRDYQIESQDYIDKFYALTKVAVVDCHNRPVAGVRVAMSGSKYRVTGKDGIATFKLRNFYTRDRKVKGVVIDRGNCFTLGCADECNPCLPSTNYTMLSSCFEHVPENTLYPPLSVNTEGLAFGKKGLKAGGRYPFGWVLEGDCGRLSAVNETTYLDIPKTQEKGSLGFCSYSFNAHDITLPSWGNRLKIVRGANLNNYDLQWIVGTIDRTSDGKIKLTIQSLNDYNTQYNFKTNTVYKYLQGDRVEFIRNGDGEIFGMDTKGILNYLTLSPFNDEVISGVTNDVNYFNQLLIVDDGRLDDLIEGATIEIQTPSISTVETTYFEICTSIPVVNGKLVIEQGTFETFDTFLINRQIDKYPAQLFESKTPSDFWGGTNLDDTGKVHFLNKYENEKRYDRNISINSEGVFNYFGDYEKTLDAKGQGGIIAMGLKGDKIGIAICENAPFLFQVSDDLVRLGSDNVIHAVPADNVISNPEINLRGDYGCSYDDIGSILFGDGFVTYISSKHNGYIIHDYQSAKKAGTRMSNSGELITTCHSFFTKRIREKETFNKSAANVLDHFRYSTGWNKNTGVVFLTLKSLRHSSVNNEKKVYAAPNDTIMYNPINDNFLGFASFTMEGYSQLNLKTEGGCSFIGYQNSLPYIFPSIPDKFNEFCGIACDMVVGVTLNKFNDKIKIPVALEIQSDKMFFASEVTTEMSQFISEIPPIKVKENQKHKWNAALLNNINSRGGLYSGEKCRSYYTKVTLVRDNTLNFGYGTIDNTKRVEFSEIDNIIIKFQMSEQSGFDGNI